MSASPAGTRAGSTANEADADDAGAAPAAKTDWQQQKAEQARIRKLENGLKRAEERIAELEAAIAAIDGEFARPENATNSAKLNELTAKQEEYRTELETCYGTWEELSLALEG